MADSMDASPQWYDPSGGKGRITNPYGIKKSYYARGAHTGVDYALDADSPAYSIGKGKVTASAFDPTVGNYVTIDYGNGREVTYQHLNSSSVKVGQDVNGGFQIGLVGNTGSSSRGSHLHTEYKVGGTYVSPETFFGKDSLPSFAKGSYVSTQSMGKQFNFAGGVSQPGGSASASDASSDSGPKTPSNLGARLASPSSSTNVVSRIY